MNASWKMFWIALLFMSIFFIEAENDLKKWRFEKEGSLDEAKPPVEIPTTEKMLLSLFHTDSNNLGKMNPDTLPKNTEQENLVKPHETSYEAKAWEWPSIQIEESQSSKIKRYFLYLLYVSIAFLSLKIMHSIYRSCCKSKSKTEEVVAVYSPSEAMPIGLNVCHHGQPNPYSQQPVPYPQQLGPCYYQPGPYTQMASPLSPTAKQ